MFNKEQMITAVEALGFTFAGSVDSTGSRYEFGGHAVDIYESGMVHHKPNGTRKYYYDDASVARIRSAMVKSLAYYKVS